MTAPFVSRVITFLGTGTVGPFKFDFPVLLSDTGVPYIDLTKVSASGARTALNYPADFSFTALRLGLGGGIINTTAVVAGDGTYLVVEGDTPVSQDVRYANQGEFFPETHEKSYDKLTYIAQEFKAKLDKVIRLNAESEVEAPVIDDPQAGRALIYNSDGTRIINGPNAADITSAQGYAAAALAAEVAAEAARNAAQAAQAAAEAAGVGIKIRPNVVAATTAALPANTYANGASGVGATLTANANGAFPAQDGIAVIVGDRFLVKDEVSQLKDGVYTLTQAGNAGAPYILTRATDADSWNELVSMVVTATGGTVNGGLTYITTIVAGGTIGTTAVTWTTFNTSIIDGAVTTNKLAASAVTGPKIATDVALPGSPTTTSQIGTDNTTKLATTAQVQAAISTSGRNSQGVKTISTSAPSGTPTDGDIWLQY